MLSLLEKYEFWAHFLLLCLAQSDKWVSYLVLIVGDSLKKASHTYLKSSGGDLPNERI